MIWPDVHDDSDATLLPHDWHWSTMSSCILRSRTFARGYATASGSSPLGAHTLSPFRLFDRNAKRIQKDHAALRESGERSRMVDYVREEVADRLFERVLVRILLFTTTAAIIADAFLVGH